MIFIRLFWEFFKTGLFAVGGGLATLPFLSRIADTTGWFTQKQLANMIAVSESTPGPIGVNMATYVGFTTAGIPGSLVATLGLITPSVIIVLIIAVFLRSFKDNDIVKKAFYCLRPASTGLIAAAGLSVAAITFLPSAVSAASFWKVLDWKAVVLAAVLLFLTRGVKKTKKLHPIIWIAVSAAAGIIFHFGGV
ncbi:MAG: chromate transporter [Oscillospiraceae bacterium]|jgi:chromate transporter|nr:chromate transporter [Oscillospiraceae bacterium]